MEQPTKKRSPTAGSWKPGQSGNPGGRPRSGLALVDAVRTHVPPAALVKVAYDAINDPTSPHRDRLIAAKLLADWGFVKPAEHHVVSAGSAQESDDDEAALEHLTIDELRVLRDLDARRATLLAAGRARGEDAANEVAPTGHTIDAIGAASSQPTGAADEPVAHEPHEVTPTGAS